MVGEPSRRLGVGIGDRSDEQAGDPARVLGVQATDAAGAEKTDPMLRASRHRTAAILTACGRRLLPRLVAAPEPDLEPLDARALDVRHAERRAVVLDLVSLLGGAPEQAEDEAADRVVVVLRQRGAELLVEVVDRERAVDADRVFVDTLDGLVR